MDINQNSLSQKNHAYLIAIVDDDKDLLEMYSEFLMLNGFKTITFGNPHHLLEHIQTNSIPFSLVITDYRMPNMNGIDLIKNIYKLPNHVNGKTKFILLSAFIKEDLIYSNKEKLDGLSIEKILEKPCSLSELKAAVIDVLIK